MDVESQATLNEVVDRLTAVETKLANLAVTHFDQDIQLIITNFNQDIQSIVSAVKDLTTLISTLTIQATINVIPHK
jgi:hypothetical protein